MSLRFPGINLDSTAELRELPLENITAQTLIISARDDGFNTLPAAEFAAKKTPRPSSSFTTSVATFLLDIRIPCAQRFATSSLVLRTRQRPEPFAPGVENSSAGNGSPSRPAAAQRATRINLGGMELQPD